jgi:uncharacterized membrane protein YqaE (UPF0057 family)
MRPFLLYVFALLIPCFALWTVAGAALATPAVGLVHLILTSWFPDIVHALYLDQANGLLMTGFGEKNGALVPLSEAEYRLGFRINPRIVSYSLPFYTALYFACQRERYLGGYVWGLLVLYALLVFGLACLCLRELVVNLGGVFLEQPGVFVPNADVIGVLYQFSVLLVPTLAPVVIWVWQSRDTPLLRMAWGGRAY